MNSLQQELNNINQQLEHLNARKAQLEPIIAEYSDVINRVKNLVSNMIDVNVEPSNLMFDIQDLVNLEDEPDTTPEPTPEPQPGQDFPTDWIDATTEAHSEQPEDYDTFYPELTPEPTPQPVKMFAFIPGLPPELTQEPTPEPTPSPQPGQNINGNCDKEESHHQFSIGDIVQHSPSNRIFEVTDGPNIDGFIHVRPLVGVLPMYLPPSSLTKIPKPEPDSEECSKCEGEGVIESPIEEDQTCPTCGGTGEKTEPTPEPKLTQINMQAYRRGDVLVIGFTNKRLMNQWSKWFKSTWSDQVSISTYSDNLPGFNHALTVLWYGKADWERLTKLNYSLKPTEQNWIGQVASSEEE